MREGANPTKRALAMPKLPSAFSKSMGLTLCGMADEPMSAQSQHADTARSHSTQSQHAATLCGMADEPTSVAITVWVK